MTSQQKPAPNAGALPSAVDAFVSGYREAQENSLPDSCEWHGGEGSSGLGCPECADEPGLRRRGREGGWHD